MDENNRMAQIISAKDTEINVLKLEAKRKDEETESLKSENEDLRNALSRLVEVGEKRSNLRKRARKN